MSNSLQPHELSPYLRIKNKRKKVKYQRKLKIPNPLAYRFVSWNSSTLATSCEELTHWKRLWCWVGLGAGGEGDDRGWDGWMASLTRWTWVSVNSGSWWWTGRPGVVRFMGSQIVGHDWATDLIWWVKGSWKACLRRWHLSLDLKQGNDIVWKGKAGCRQRKYMCEPLRKVMNLAW